jgi:hypothetical protein
VKQNIHSYNDDFRARIIYLIAGNKQQIAEDENAYSFDGVGSATPSTNHRLAIRSQNQQIREPDPR